MQTWPNVHKTSAGGIGNVVYQRLFRQEPKQRELLQKANAVLSFGRGGSNMTTEHIKLLTELLNDMIANIDRLDEVGERCAEIGAQHAPLHHQGFEADLWDRFGQVMLESVTQLDSVRKHRELVKAWRVVISYLVDKFRQGYETGVRRANYQQQQTLASQQDEEDADGDSNGTNSGPSDLHKMSIR